MTYTNQEVSHAERFKAIAGVGIIHAALGAALITGLTVSGMIETQDRPLVAFDVKDKPLPQPPPYDPETPKPQPRQASPEIKPRELAAPRSTIAFDLGPSTPEIDLSDIPIITGTIGPIDDGKGLVIVPTPTPEPSFAAMGARPQNNKLNWVTPDDYPRRDLIQQNEGKATFRLVVGTNGKPQACEILSSTGHKGLDEATCKQARRRAEFHPATDHRGERILGTYTSTIVWRIPK